MTEKLHGVVRFDRGKVDLDELTELELVAYLLSHPLLPVRGGGVIRLEFQDHPPTRLPQLEFLVRHQPSQSWLLRWPNGALKWATEAWLLDRGLLWPVHPLVADITSEPSLDR